MIQSFKKKMKEQKGFTLIELLAVIVILGIIAAIAIPSILNLIQNSKDDAQRSNAQQMVSAARNAVSQNDVDFVSTSTGKAAREIDIEHLVSLGYIEDISNPDKKYNYDKNASFVAVTKPDGTTKNFIYKVTLVGTDGTSTVTYFNDISSDLLSKAAVTSTSVKISN